MKSKALTSSDKDKDKIKDKDKDNIVEALYIPCPWGGRHTMSGRGSSGKIVRDGQVVLNYAHIFQCSKCKELNFRTLIIHFEEVPLKLYTV